MTKVVLTDVAGGYNLSKINANFEKIEDTLNNEVLFRYVASGESNTLEQDLDINGKRLYNLAAPVLDQEAATVKYVKDYVGANGGGGGSGGGTLDPNLYTNLDMHGYTVVNIRNASSPQEPVTLGQFNANPNGYETLTHANATFSTKAETAAILPSQAGNSGKVLATNGVTVSWVEQTGGTGSGAAGTSETFIALAGQTVFNISTPGFGATTPASVAINGVLQDPSDAYTQGSGIITLSEGVDLGTEVVVRMNFVEAPDPEVSNEIVIAVLGDSITSNATARENAWPEKVEDMLNQCGENVRVVNLAAGGTSFYTALNSTSLGGSTMVQKAIATNADIVIVQLGYNDASGSRTLAEIKADAAALLAALRAGLPLAKILFAAEICHDQTLFPNTSLLKNSGLLPFDMSLPVSGIQAGAYSAYALTQNASLAAIIKIDRLKEFNTYVAGLAWNDIYYVNYWQIARLGTLMHDGLHPLHSGVQLLAHANLAGINASTTITELPKFKAMSLEVLGNLNNIFNSLLVQSGSEWVNKTPDPDIDKIVYELSLERKLNPTAWYLPYKTKFSVQVSSTLNSPTVIIINNGPPSASVQSSALGGAFSASGVFTDVNGDAFVPLPTAYTGNNNLIKIGNEIYGPFNVTANVGAETVNGALTVTGAATIAGALTVNNAANITTSVTSPILTASSALTVRGGNVPALYNTGVGVAKPIMVIGSSSGVGPTEVVTIGKTMVSGNYAVILTPAGVPAGSAACPHITALTPTTFTIAKTLVTGGTVTAGTYGCAWMVIGLEA